MQISQESQSHLMPLVERILYLFLLFQDNMIFEMPNQVVQVGQLIFYKKEKKGTVKSI